MNNLSSVALFVYRLVKHLAVLFLVCLPLQALGILILLPVCAIFRESNQLPKDLRWFDSADSYVGRDTSVYDAVRSSGIWNRYVWLAFRNPLNYFGYKILGIHPQTSIEAIYEPIPGLDIGDTTHPGLYSAEALIDNKRYFEYYLIYQYKRFPKYCFRFRMGHKLKYIKENQLNSYIQWVMVISPLHSYTGV